MLDELDYKGPHAAEERPLGKRPKSKAKRSSCFSSLLNNCPIGPRFYKGRNCLAGKAVLLEEAPHDWSYFLLYRSPRFHALSDYDKPFVQALDLLLVEGSPTRGGKAERIQLPRQLAKTHPLRPAGANKGRRLPQARVLL